jgi:hypothetical protein
MSKFNVLETEYTDIKSKETFKCAMLCNNSRIKFGFLMTQGLVAMVPGYKPLVFMLMNDHHKAAASGTIVIKSSGISDVDCRTVVNAFASALDDKLTNVLIAVPTYDISDIESVEPNYATILTSYTFAYLDSSNYYEGTFGLKTSVCTSSCSVDVLVYDLEYTKETLSTGEMVEQNYPMPIDELCGTFKLSLDMFVFDKTCSDVASDGASNVVLVDSSSTLQ